MSLLTPTTPAVSLAAAGICQPVISYIYPETRQTVARLWAEAPHHLFAAAYTGHQDEYHLPFLASYKTWVKPFFEVPDALSFAYATGGSTEAIRETLAQYAATRPAGRVHLFHGEYEGFAEMAKAYGLKVIRHDRAHFEQSLAKSLKPGDRFYISEPSAINGYAWTRFAEWLSFMNTAYPTVLVYLDLCYVGTSAKTLHYNFQSPNIAAIFFSLSKTFGIYYHRIGGVFSRTALPGLAGNIWFKNMFSLYLGRTLLDTFPLGLLPAKYLASQRQAVQMASQKLALPAALVPSQALMLAVAPVSDPLDLPAYLQPLWRGTPGLEGWLRVCLTPTLDTFHA